MNKYNNTTISTGIQQIDALLNGGFHKGDLSIIATMPDINKTAYANQLASSSATIVNVPAIINKSGITTKDIKELIITRNADAVFIDCLELITPKENRESLLEETSDIAFELRKIAEDSQVAIICFSQLSKNEKGQFPDLEYPLPTEIEQEASVIISLSRSECSDDKNNPHIDLIIAKNKYGSIGTISSMVLGIT